MPQHQRLTIALSGMCKSPIAKISMTLVLKITGNNKRCGNSEPEEYDYHIKAIGK